METIVISANHPIDLQTYVNQKLKKYDSEQIEDIKFSVSKGSGAIYAAMIILK